jgi:protein ImuA
MRVQRLEELQAAIHAIEGAGRHNGGVAWVNLLTRADSTDRHGPAALAHATPQATLSLPPGAVHEWFGTVHAAHGWTPPLSVLLHLALRSLEAAPGCVVWIGRRCWPYPRVLSSAGRRRSIFVDPPDGASRLWAIDLAARCPGVTAVVADGSGLDMAATRRLQLAAEAGSALVLCARPPDEADRLSAAATRWRVRCAPSPGKAPRWIVELLRCKGVQPESEVPRTVEWQGAQGGVVVHAALVDRPDPAERPQAEACARRSA